MSKSQSSASLTGSAPINDPESQSAPSPAYQRALDAIGDQTALIIDQGKKKTTLTCEPSRVEYELSYTSSWKKLQTFTRISRRDVKEAQDVLIAEWELNFFGTDRLRLASSVLSKDFSPAKSYLIPEWSFKSYFSFWHRFEVNGRTYVWKSQLLSDDGSLKLSPEGCDEPIAKTVGRRCLIKPRLGYIELLRDKDILDEVIVTWAIVKQRRTERALIFSLVHTLLFEVLFMTLMKVFVWH